MILSGEAMALQFINKIISNLKLLYQKNKFLAPELRGMLCNTLIQLRFDYSFPALYPTLPKKQIKKKQVEQNKCIRFCLRLNKMFDKVVTYQRKSTLTYKYNDFQGWKKQLSFLSKANLWIHSVLQNRHKKQFCKV